MKPITAAAVCQAATALIVAEGGTSTLLVQQFLRNRGYQTRQAEVSNWLSTGALQEGWIINDTGLFRNYAFPSIRT